MSLNPPISQARFKKSNVYEQFDFTYGRWLYYLSKQLSSNCIIFKQIAKCLTEIITKKAVAIFT